MFTIQKLNKISSKGLDLMPRDDYEVASELSNPDAILVRSFKMLDMELPPKLKAVARAGAGVNNIPVQKCTEKGIVVFNTPGANANGVKELVLASLFISSRRINKGINWTQALKGKGDEVPKLVEKNKSEFAGPEIFGKKLGVIGLGAIGAMVANAVTVLGMEVMGYDPFISVDAAWGLSRNVVKATNLDQLIASSDYITIHVPLNNKTKAMFNKDKFDIMKKGIRIINLARGGLVLNKDLIEAVENGTVGCYVTDFPEDELLGYDNIITIPHLGASTPESEENCAIMAVRQLRSFLEKGNIENSINFPECTLEKRGHTRITVAHDNVPNMVGQITTILASSSLNIADMLNRHKNGIGYSIIDIESPMPDQIAGKIKSIEGVKMVRIL